MNLAPVSREKNQDCLNTVSMLSRSEERPRPLSSLLRTGAGSSVKQFTL